jgi:hypothetical protein
MEEDLLKAQQTQGVAPDSENEGMMVKYQGISPNLPKGAKVNPEEKLEAGILVTDTGVHTECLEAFKDKDSFTPEEIDEIYEATIRAGVIDHHVIDSFFSAKGVDSKKCATQMVFDYKEAVLAMVKEKGITNVETHFDSDMDAIGSSYMVRSLIDNGELPSIAEDLAAVTNLEDYGENKLDPEPYVNSLAGTVGSIKDMLGNQARASLGKDVFGNPDMKDENGRLTAEGVQKMNLIKSKFENMRNEYVFAVFNALEKAKTADPDFDIKGDISGLELPEEIAKVVSDGREAMRASMEEFLVEFEAAEKAKMTVKDREGNDIDVNVVIGSSKKPLIFTNMAYLRTNPDTIVACYAGEDRAFGDNYDIGITPDMANSIDMSALCLALNKAEKEKRDALRSKEDPTDDEKAMIEGWDGQADREAFSGLNDKIASGEVPAEDVITKDPTVLVAGGSLIAASRTSLLGEEDFKKVFDTFKK